MTIEINKPKKICCVTKGEDGVERSIEIDWRQNPNVSGIFIESDMKEIIGEDCEILEMYVRFSDNSFERMLAIDLGGDALFARRSVIVRNLMLQERKFRKEAIKEGKVKKNWVLGEFGRCI